MNAEILARIARLAEDAKTALRQRDEAIREAVQAGHSHMSVERAAGMGNGTVRRIVERAEKEGTRW